MDGREGLRPRRDPLDARLRRAHPREVVPPEAGDVSSADNRYVIAIDLGTTGLKAGLVSTRGTIVWKTDAQLETVWVDRRGAEQDAELWWQLLVREVRAGLASGVVAPEQIVAVSTTGQWASTVP